ncbi:hypothetical protein LTR12_003788 [Friedmanniomyces endolithicus]|nr:hypothetical protein LTR12_003788 [Friedmanniomyces endolithicus]
MAPLSLLTRLAGSALLFTISVRAQAPPTYQCPGLNDATVNDQYGNPFVVQCQASTAVSQYDVQTAANTWDDCFTQCQASTAGGSNTCTSFTYGGAANGAGSGNCYLKNAIPNGGTDSFTTSSGNVIDFVSAIRTTYYNSAGNTYVAFNPTPYGSCPSANGTVITDGSSYQYEVGCAYTQITQCALDTNRVANDRRILLAAPVEPHLLQPTAGTIALHHAIARVPLSAQPSYTWAAPTVLELVIATRRAAAAFLSSILPTPTQMIWWPQYAIRLLPVFQHRRLSPRRPPPLPHLQQLRQTFALIKPSSQMRITSSTSSIAAMTLREPPAPSLNKPSQEVTTRSAKHTVTRTPVEPGSGHLAVALVESATSRMAFKAWLPAHLAWSLV